MAERRITEEERQKLFDMIAKGIIFRCQEEWEKCPYLRYGDKVDFKIDYTFHIDTAMIFDRKKS